MTYIPDVWTARNDGSGSGLDADKLDTLEATAFLQDINSEILSEISDVAAYSSIAAGEILEWSGSAWVHQTLAEAGIQAAGSYLTDITGESIGSLSDVTVTAGTNGDVLVAAAGVWVDKSLAEAGIQPAGSYLTNINSEILSEISDVAAYSSLASGEVLVWSGSAWVHQTLAEASISATSHAHAMGGLSDVEVAGVGDGDFMRYAAGGSNFWYDDTTANVVTDLIAAGLLGDINSEILSEISDVAAYSSLASGEVLVWSGSAWVHQTLAEAGIQAAGSVADLTVAAKTGAYTLLTSDDVVTGDSSGGTFTLTLPAASGNAGKLYHIKKIDSSANVVTIDGAAAETIDGAATITLDVQFHAVTIVCDGANWLLI